jgi:deoxyribodipyrimidine photo-lyase
MPFYPIRIQPCNHAPVNPHGDYVLYWMIAARRTDYNFSLDRAVEWCRELRKPLLVFEPLRFDFPWASDRLRNFVAAGMASNSRWFGRKYPNAIYYPYLEPYKNAGKGLLGALASSAAVVVTDEFPCFFLPRMVAAAAKKLPVLLEQVDSNGLVPLRATDHAFPSALVFRRFLQKHVEPYLYSPYAHPLDRTKKQNLPTIASLPKSITDRWPPAELDDVACSPFPDPAPLTERIGGSGVARYNLLQFLVKKLPRYTESHSDPTDDFTSGLSPYLHFGHISTHEIFIDLVHHEKWGPEKLALRSTGAREGWWNMSAPAEAFLDQLVTWRELGFNFCYHRADYDQFASLPDWAQRTLCEHAHDKREHLYTLDELRNAQTYDPLWNAAQTQLVTEGRLHNYLRMLWGKKILEWTRTPKEALQIMTELNNAYAIDGRDPNSYSGILWCLGRYDRPWPERPIFGTVRFMSSANTARKLNVKPYLRRYSPSGDSQLSIFTA